MCADRCRHGPLQRSARLPASHAPQRCQRGVCSARAVCARDLYLVHAARCVQRVRSHAAQLLGLGGGGGGGGGLHGGGERQLRLQAALLQLRKERARISARPPSSSRARATAQGRTVRLSSSARSSSRCRKDTSSRRPAGRSACARSPHWKAQHRGCVSMRCLTARKRGPAGGTAPVCVRCGCCARNVLCAALQERQCARASPSVCGGARGSAPFAARGCRRRRAPPR